MKKNLFSLWVFLFAVFCVTNISAQATIGNTNGKAKAAEAFSALEVISNGKGGLRLPQLTTAQRNTLALASVTDPIRKPLASGLSIFNTTTNCVEYWSVNRWISLCDGTSQTTVGPAPCTTVAADGTGCDSTFSITDPDCPNGPFKISIIAGADYATLSNVDEADGTYKLNFGVNESVSSRSVLVRVTSTCTSQYKDFIYMQDGVACTALGTAPTISPVTPSQSLCSGGAVYLSVPATTANLDKLIWTRNGIEVARGVSYYIATLKGTYNVSLGAAGCNVSTGNARVITDSSTAAPTAFTTLIASNNGVICGTANSVTLTLAGGSGTISWFRNGVLTGKFGNAITVSGSEAGDWFATAGSGSCFSKPSNTVPVTVNTASGSIVVSDSDVLVNGLAIKTFTSFCAGGSLTLKVNNPIAGVNYTWYNGQDVISSPYIVPTQGNMVLRMVASDASGTKCPAESATTSLTVTAGTAPGTPIINGNGVVCDGTADLSIVPAQAGTYTYQWYKNGVLLPNTEQTISIKETGSVYSATVTSTGGCVSPYATKTISSEVSSLPVLSWVSGVDKANFGDKITYQVAAEHGPITTYKWTVDGGATTLGSGASSTITFPSTGGNDDKINLKVTATNACGTSVELTKVIAMSPMCPTPVVTAGSATALNTISKVGVTMKVNVTSANAPTYQWYAATAADATSGGTAIAGATSSSYVFTPSAAGTSYFYCVVKNGCTGTPAALTTPPFTVTTAADPETLTAGSGTFAGKTCFDVNLSNDGAGCGTKSSRISSATDFNTQSAQNYIFTASATGVKKNLRFIIKDLNGAVESTNADAIAVTGTVSNSEVITLTVNFKKSLSGPAGIAFGKTADQAVKLSIYAVYNDGTKDVSIPVEINIKDCACCGAYISPTVFKEFMCYNLGADTTIDPLTPAPGSVGDWYQWGAKTPYAKAANPATATNYTKPTSFSSVRPTDMYLWGTNKAGNVKGTADPCPSGYRVPSQSELVGVVNNNTRTIINTVGSTFAIMTSGTKFGNLLMLPNGSYRSAFDGTVLSNSTIDSIYFSSGGYIDSYQATSDVLRMTATRVDTSGVIGMICGTPIRCIAE